MLKQRIVSAIIMLIVFLIVNFAIGDAAFIVAMSVLAGVAAWEWSQLAGVRYSGFQYAAAATTLLIVLICLWLLPASETGRWASLLSLIFWTGVAMLCYLVPTRTIARAEDSVNTARTDWPLMLLGPVLLLGCCFFTYYLHTEELGGSPWLIIYALAVVWFMDVGAYFAGKRWGKTKLAPAISPGKTWEGIVGGISCVVVLVVAVLFFSEFARQHVLAFLVGTLLAAIASVFGDLYESRLKRSAGVKDSSQLIPGHGGVLDRIDGVIAAIPVFAFAWIWL